jgi:hypothetical protein
MIWLGIAIIVAVVVFAIPYLPDPHGHFLVRKPVWVVVGAFVLLLPP